MDEPTQLPEVEMAPPTTRPHKKPDPKVGFCAGCETENHLTKPYEAHHRTMDMEQREKYAAVELEEWFVWLCTFCAKTYAGNAAMHPGSRDSDLYATLGQMYWMLVDNMERIVGDLAKELRRDDEQLWRCPECDGVSFHVYEEGTATCHGCGHQVRTS